jgi:hypothetical protein
MLVSTANSCPTLLLQNYRTTNLAFHDSSVMCSIQLFLGGHELMNRLCKIDLVAAHSYFVQSSIGCSHMSPSLNPSPPFLATNRTVEFNIRIGKPRTIRPDNI